MILKMTKVSGQSELIGYFPRSFEKILHNFVCQNCEKKVISE